MNPWEAAALQANIVKLREDLLDAEKRHQNQVRGMWQRLRELEGELQRITRREEEQTPPPQEMEAVLPQTVESEVVFATAPAEPVTEPAVPPSVPAFRAAMQEHPAAPVPPPFPVAKSGSFELQFGRVWLVRLGIGLLVTGLVLLGNFAYKNWIRDLAPGIRLAALYLGSLMLSGAGFHLAARENLRRFGEVLIAGGMAFFYWCTFAAHHVPRLRVVESPVFAGVLLLLAAGAIVAISLRRDSKATAVMGLLLASYATVLQPLGWLSAASNMVLAGMGTALMLRPGWVAPGIAAMAGTYLSFFWWQIAGAIGSRPDDPAALWFLPPVWAMFALPGVLGISKHFSGLSERERAAFATANNIGFFALFSIMWQELHGSSQYWLVPGVFGLVLLALGAIGRSKDQAGGCHFAQGIAALTLALVLKLEGYHLALALAGQALGLSLSFARYRGRSELVFALVAVAGATLLVLDFRARDLDLPAWSYALTAVLLTAAAFPLRRACDLLAQAEWMGKAARVAAAIAFLAGGSVALLGWCLELEPFWRAPAAAGIALGMSAFTLLRDRERRFGEAALVVLVSHFASVTFLLMADRDLRVWSLATAALLSLASHWLWVRHPVETRKSLYDLAGLPATFLWMSSLAAFAAFCRMQEMLHLPLLTNLLSLSAAAIALAALARFFFRSPVLLIVATFFLPIGFALQLAHSGPPWITEFIPVAAALALTGIAILPQGNEKFRPATIVSRSFALLSWIAAWIELAPEACGEIFAASGIALLLLSRHFRQNWPEAWAMLGTGALWLLKRFVTLPWETHELAGLPYGAGVILSFFIAGFLMKKHTPKGASPLLLFTGAALLATWSSQLLIWHFDWKPVAVLWTGLGFLLVCTGLWQKTAALRHAGFILLAMSLAKLFTMDVWDFNTFTRVAAFLALGVALVVLGFFYNRFADVLKKLFEADGAQRQ